MIPAPDDPLLTPEQVLAEFFAGDPKITARYVREHVRPVVRLSARVLRFRRSAVIAWLASREQAA